MIYIFDTETTGLNEPELIEAAGIELVSIAPIAAGKTFWQYYKPSKPIELGALATHHIMDEDLLDKPPSSTFALPAGTQYLIGHNIDFDATVINLDPSVKKICTLAMARKLWPQLPTHKQVALIYHLDRANARERVRNAHSALEDVKLCQSLLEAILKETGITTIEDLYAFSEVARNPTHIPFGKYQGALISEFTDVGYLDWIIYKAKDPDPYLVKACQKRLSELT